MCISEYFSHFEAVYDVTGKEPNSCVLLVFGIIFCDRTGQE